MFLRKQIEDVGFLTEEVGLAFVHANDTGQQRQILLVNGCGRGGNGCLARRWLVGHAVSRNSLRPKV
jgi:hypothetical protein